MCAVCIGIRQPGPYLLARTRIHRQSTTQQYPESWSVGSQRARRDITLTKTTQHIETRLCGHNTTIHNTTPNHKIRQCTTEARTLAPNCNVGYFHEPEDKREWNERKKQALPLLGTLVEIGISEQEVEHKGLAKPTRNQKRNSQHQNTTLHHTPQRTTAHHKAPVLCQAAFDQP